VVVRHGVRTSNDVALTFDMGGRVGDALAIVNWLVEHEVQATIFMTGWMADNPNNTDFRDLTAGEIADELARTEAAIAPYCSQNPRPFFRPPNGGYDAEALAAIGANHYRYTVLWDVDTIDWRPVKNDPPGPTADEIVAKVLANARGGSIVLMHLGGYHTFEALPRIVEGLGGAGYDLVNLDAMF
jgi:peptidoglycan/xylan/chitin deacetylase (PgdA/CDA1 family)